MSRDSASAMSRSDDDGLQDLLVALERMGFDANEPQELLCGHGNEAGRSRERRVIDIPGAERGVGQRQDTRFVTGIRLTDRLGGSVLTGVSVDRHDVDIHRSSRYPDVPGVP